MSSIYFHSKTDTVELDGRERGHASSLTRDLMMMFLPAPFMRGDDDWRRNLFPSSEDPSFLTTDRITKILPYTGTLCLHGRQLQTFYVSLNTAIACGSDPIRLLARLHGQCEIHCFVREHNRKWLADIIREGRRAGLLRGGMGWEELVELLETPDDGPVVCAHSACDDFPDPYLLPEDHPVRRHKDPYEALHNLDDPFAACFAMIEQERGLELRPDDWAALRFGDEPSAWELEKLYRDGLESGA